MAVVPAGGHEAEKFLSLRDVVAIMTSQLMYYACCLGDAVVNTPTVLPVA